MSDAYAKEYDIYTGLLKAFPLPVVESNGINFSSNNSHPMFDTLKKNIR